MSLGFNHNDFIRQCHAVWLPNSNLLQLPLQKEFMEELGLVNNQGYDFFQNRIVIPIKDRYQHIIGFTARV